MAFACEQCGTPIVSTKFCTSCGATVSAERLLLGAHPPPASPQPGAATPGVPNAPVDLQWFVGDIKKSAAETRLANHPPGTFLVRGPTSKNQDYILSVVDPETVRHYQIAEINGSFRITSGRTCPFFKNLAELVKYYQTTTALGGTSLRSPVGALASPSGAAPAFLPTSAPHGAQPAPLASAKGSAAKNSTKCPQCDTERTGTAMFCRACGYSFKAKTVTIAAASKDEDAPPPAKKASSKIRKVHGQSMTYWLLTERIESCEKLYDLICLGNDILKAEKESTLLEGELGRLRTVYRLQRGRLHEGCLKTAWTPDREAPSCQICDVPFGRFRGNGKRRHHCRNCGKCVCKGCSSQKFERAGLRLAKVCPVCYQFLSEVAAGHVRQATIDFEDAMSSKASTFDGGSTA